LEFGDPEDEIVFDIFIARNWVRLENGGFEIMFLPFSWKAFNSFDYCDVKYVMFLFLEVGMSICGCSLQILLCIQTDI